MQDNPTIRVNEQAARKLMQGYPWIFKSEVINAKQAAHLPEGGLVTFTREKGDFIGYGYYNPRGQLVGRILSRKEGDEINVKFIETRIAAALAFRDRLYAAPFYRLIHAESDGLPGLIIDRFDDILVAQVNTAGMERLWPLVEKALIKLIDPQDIVLRNDTAARETEGLENHVKTLKNKLEKPLVTIRQGEVKFNVDVLHGQKTGWFYDQRDNRAFVAALSQGQKMIDIFCHTGGFGVTAGVAGASDIIFVDSSESALATARANAALNGLDKKSHFIEGAAFDVMEKLATEGKKFGVVSVDPPAFVKSRKDHAVGIKGYQKLARLAASLVDKGGILFYASCSSHVSRDELIETVSSGLYKSGRSFQLIKTLGAGADHPVHPALPETEYLKGLTFRFLD